MRKLIMSGLLLLGIYASPATAQISNRPALALECIDREAIFEVYEIALNQPPIETINEVQMMGICSVQYGAIIPQYIQDIMVMITPVVMDWEGDPMAIFEYPWEDQMIYLLVLNADMIKSTKDKKEYRVEV